MSKHNGREVALVLLVVCMVLVCACSSWAEMTMLPENTTKATANSVWNIGVTWQDSNNVWPLYLPDYDTDDNLQPDPSATLISQRIHISARQDLDEIERDIDDPRPGIRLKWSDGTMSDMSSSPWGGDQKDVERVPFPAIGSPEQQALENFLTPSGHVFLGWTGASWESHVRNGFPIGIATVIEQDPNVTGFQTQVYVRRHFYQYTYADPSVTPPKRYRVTIEVPPVIVPRRVPTANLRIFLDKDRTIPYTDFMIANAQDRYCRRSVEEWDAERGRWNHLEDQTSAVAEPLWDMLDIDTTVIVLDPFAGGVDANGEYDDRSNPDPTPVLRPVLQPDATETSYRWIEPKGIEIERIYFAYTIEGSQYVLLPRAPLPAPDTTYRIPALNSLDGSVKLKINKGILGLDPNRTDPNDADPRYPDRPGINSPILGVYRTPNPGPDDPNLFVPGKYSDAGRYGVIRIESDKLDGTLPDWTDLYVKVSTWGLDAVWTRFDEISDLRFPRRINYFRKPEWMTGVITGNWTGFGPDRPPSPASNTAYTVKPDIDPTSVGMRAVTGIFLPQIMSGTVYDRTHVVPADRSKIGMVLGVYALSSQRGTRYDDMHVEPSNPSAITFISAVYAKHTMSGTPIDPKHVKPAKPSEIRRVLSVKVPGQATEYYDPLEHPWTPGDTIITLKDDPNINIPPGTVSVTITYETTSLYDPEDPALAYRYDPNEPLSRLITLTRPIPQGATDLRIVYGMGTGLDGFNYYDPNNPTTVYRPDVETQITLKQALPADVTDVRILYATDSVIETRATATDANHVVPPNIWRVGRVHGVYAVLEQDGVSGGLSVAQQTGFIDTSDPQRRRIIPSQPELIAKVLRVYDSSNRDYYGPVNPTNPFRPGDTVIKLDRALPANVNVVTIRYEGLANTVIPSDPTMIRKVLGVYAVSEMTATVVDSTHVAPQSPLSIRSVRGVYTIANQPGTADTNDPNRLTVIPSQPAIIGKVNGVYDNPAMTGTNYFDPNNPETVFRTGDSVIKLSIPLPPAVTSVTINYETINLGGSFTPGDSQITLTTPLPTSDPPNDPMPIRVVYLGNLNHYNVNNPVQAYQPGDSQIVLNTPLPLGTVDVAILYAEAWNRYRFLTPPSNPIPDFVPGHDSITLAVPLGGLPAGTTEAVVEFSGHLFAPSYDPFDYNPDNTATYQYRPFIPGDKIIRLNRLDPNVPLWSRYTGPGALKLCIAYQSNKKVPMGTYTQSGRVDLPIPLPIKYNSLGTVTTSPEVYSDFRVLTSVNLSSNRDQDQDSPVLATYTVGIPYRGRVEKLSFYEGESLPHPLPQISPEGKFSFLGPPGVTRVSVTYRREEPDSRNGVVWAELGGKYKGRIPLYYDRNTPGSGAIYRVAVSAGLNLSNPKQQPSCNLEENTPFNTNRLIFDPRYNPMWYTPILRAKSCGAPHTYEDVTVRGIGYGPNGWVEYSAKQNMTVHDSRPKSADEMIDHGGRNGNRDYLTCMPRLGDPDPLVTEIAEEINPSRPDDGSSSTQFVFRVRYNNKDGLPPQPWLHPLDDVWNRYDKRPTGVVLYLDEKGIGDYQPHFMAPEDPNKEGAGQIYIYRVIPHHEFVVPADENRDPELYPWPVGWISDNWSYRSLACGVYHYFFACSDDSLKFDDGSFPFQNQGTTANLLEWGEYPYRGGARTWSSSGLDPSLERKVTDFPEVNRPAKRRPSDSVNQLEAYDSTIYVDRPALVPGQFGWSGYGFSASEHPVVTCELRMPAVDDLNVPYDDAKYGYGRFFGTLQPYYRATNPAIRNRSERIPNDPIYRGHLALAETSGATTQTDNVFRILYRQKDNKPPIYIRVYINNASYKSGSGPEYQYKAYTMYPRADQPQPYDYRKGVWYEYKTKLPPGPHTYYFQAYDGYHVVRFPVRPDKYIYDKGDDPSTYGWYMDAWVPTDSQYSERGNPNYFDNDYFPGPYVNNPCVLSEASVTPGTGKEGTRFRYRVKYSDPDGQAPYSAYIYIEVNNRGDVRRLSMVPETPFLDPAADHSEDYKRGVYYILDTATVNDLALENGVRRFYFEFTDDWGAYYDLNDRVQGETTRYPQGSGNWITGPIISGNRAPTLTRGSVTSQDGTANAATLWTFRVTYRDLDNDPPALIKVYLGLLQPDGRTIIWDDGHTMQQADPGDRVYSDGADYFFQTRLGAAEGASPEEHKQYFYAFVAYDGVRWATYYSSSNDELRSDAANAMVLDNLVRVDANTYKIRPLIVQQGTVVNRTQVKPDNPGDILRVWGVYLTEDLNRAQGALGTNYCDQGSGPPDFVGDSVMLTSELPAGTSRVWIHYEARSPIVGPLPIDLPAPAGVIPDAQIYEDYSNKPTPIPIDDQKNGWINDDPSKPEDRGILRMNGLAVFEGRPSVNYVTPERPRDIASVEGVYLTPDMTGENYYDPAQLDPPMLMTGTVDISDASRRTVIPSDPDRILYVTGVFDPNDPNPSNPTNYFMGTGYPRTVTWQEALIVGANTIWPKNPNDIVSIKGIYLTADTSTTNYYREDGLSAQLAYPYGYLANPQNPALISQVLGIYLTQSDVGTNYYNSVASPVPYMYNLIPSLPAGTTTVYVKYLDSNGNTAWQPASVYIGSIKPVDDLPIKKVLGAYLLPSTGVIPYDTDGKPIAQGKNYAPNSSYTTGSVAVQISPPLPVNDLGSSGAMYIIYESLPPGFGEYFEYIGASRSLTSAMRGAYTVFLAYYPRGTVSQIRDRKFITLTSPLPNNVNRVNIRCITRAYNCGDSVIPLTKPLPEGTTNVYIKYSDIRFTHQFRGQAHQPINFLGTITWATGTSHYSPDGWDAGSPDKLWMLGTPVDPMTIVPQDASSISTVNGVYLVRDDATLDYYAGTTVPFVEGDTTITLARAVPAQTTQVWINYSPRNIRIKNNVADVTSGVIGVWQNASRDGTNHFNPRLGARHPDNPKHLRLTTPVPDGTIFLYARCYQKGDYHIDRWNRTVVFLPGKEKDESTPIQASYFFGTRMPRTIGPNTPPILTDGKVNKLRGSRSDTFIFSVTYRDFDGPNGQAPIYVRVYIDGNPYDMTPVAQGTPAYREGAVYTFTPPDGLSGGSHKFHFEASDGAAVAIYDWYSENGVQRPTTGQTIRDIDGPWVNNPPELSDGFVSPNPTTGGIKPWESVDYFVTYTDADNDEPYFYDPVRDTNDFDADKNGIPDGQEWSGSPRVWIDSGPVDVVVTGRVEALEVDPMAPTKKRTIVVAGNPRWTNDQFAGKLLQITNGAIFGRVYLIQSNTDRKLVIATDDLEADGVKTAADPEPSTFRINGLLMFKENPAQQDFTAGVRYKITVPKLAAGTHKFHFTAMSRENKPQWLLEKLEPKDRVPYSIKVQYPASGDLDGPTVVSSPPPGNTAPTITNTADSSLYVGPMAQLAVATSLNQVEALDAAKFATIREVRGVYKNANDFVLASLAEDATKNHYNPLTATPPFAPGDSKIVLTTSLPATPPANMTQFGTADTASLITVTPDAPAVIDSVLGVYLTSDPTLSGTNYFKTADGSSTGTFNAATGVITLGQPLPSGTKTVFVNYSVKPGLTWTSNPVRVPVYVKYYAITTQTVFQASDLVTFRINYKDADNDPPSYHDGVQGYVKVVFNNLGQSRPMQLLNWTGGVVDYTKDQVFTTEPINPPEGVHKYHFEASDGYFVTRWPQGTLGDPAANDYQIKVNYRPVLSAGKVEPTAGQSATTFMFTVTYKDTDGPGKNQPQVYARITRTDGTLGYVRMAMRPKSATPNYPAGTDFDLAIVPAQLTPPLGPGQYKVVFEATDGDGEDALPFPQPGETQILFTIRDTNEPPVLSDLAVEPAAGKLNTTFIYKAVYRDPDGDAPVDKVTKAKDVLTLTIDKGTANQQIVRLTKAAGQPANPTPDDYKKGVLYDNRTQPISGKKLGAGKHTFEVSATDGTSDAVPVSAEGPVLLVPYFQDFRAVDAASAKPDTAPALTTASVGQEVVFVGNMKFPDNPVTTPPAQITNITITVTKPDATTVSLTGSTTDLKEEVQSGRRIGWTAKIRASYPKGVDPSLITGESLSLTASGEWKVGISWPGDSLWDKADNAGREFKITVGGPMRTVAVADPEYPDESTPLVDMITPPKIIGSSDVGAVFGYERALDMQIVRWDPASRSYFRYGTQGFFPELLPGQAVWIKPRSTYPVETVSLSWLENGLLALGNPEAPLNDQRRYRLIKPFVKDYNRDESGAILPCSIPLQAGWNQIGNIFYNWKKDALGNPVSPRRDVGIPISELRVRYLGQTRLLAEAAAAGWIRDYAWRFDAVARQYVLVHSAAAGAERVLKAWSGYWIRAFVDCELIIDPNTTYNGTALKSSTQSSSEGVSLPSRVSAFARSGLEEAGAVDLDIPPPMPE